MKKLMTLVIALFSISISSADAVLMVNPMSMNFGGVPIGQYTSQMFWVRNVGNQPARIFSCYAYGSFQCQLNCFGSIFPGQDCMGQILFYPSNGSYESQTVFIDSSENTMDLWVRGFGIER